MKLFAEFKNGIGFLDNIAYTCWITASLCIRKHSFKILSYYKII